jgi:hypothetical protein
MEYPQISFQVRKRSSEPLAAMGEHVGQLLGCTFVESTSKMFDPGEALETTALGLSISLSHLPSASGGEPRTYVLMGGVRDDLEAQWDIDAPTISISEYVLGMLRLVDDEGWYIASEAELLAEAGIAPE